MNRNQNKMMMSSESDEGARGLDLEYKGNNRKCRG